MKLGRQVSTLCHGLLLLGILLLPSAMAHAQELMPASKNAWSAFAARPASAPVTSAAGGDGAYSLTIDGNNTPGVYGGWRTRISGLIPDRYYRFRARVVATELESPRESITIVLRWRGTFGDEVAPDYVWQYRTEPDGSFSFDRTFVQPHGTTAVDVELALQWDSNARLVFDALSFMQANVIPQRMVKAAAMSYRPSGTASGLESVQRAAEYGHQVAAARRPDVMVFGELLNVIGAPGTYDAKAEAVPGPSTDVMANLALTWSMNVAFGLLEREGPLLYNTAVFINRSGVIIGKHRKMQLPLAEVAAGISPGREVPVFNADFGRVALVICQDTAFPEVAREAAIKGAEILLHPIWGGKPELVRARAIEQSMYVVASGYDYYSEVIDPLGTTLARVEDLNQADVAFAFIDLNQRFREDWSGDWRDVSNKQRRNGTYNANPDVVPDPSDPAPTNTPPTVSLTAPSNGASFMAPATVTLTASAFDGDGKVTSVQFLVGTTELTTDVSAPYGFTWTNVPEGTYTLSARAVDNGHLATASASVTITVNAPPPPQPLPAPWQTQDVGAVGVTGKASASNGVFTVEGAGADVWGTSDAFRYVYQPVNGDVDVIARVTSIEYIHDWVKAGVMIRQRLTADSAHAFMMVTPSIKGAPFQRRTVTGGGSSSTSSGAGTPPLWVKLERRGNTITAYRSADGAAWTLVGSDTFAMPTNAYVGLAVSGHTTWDLATVTFDNVTVVPVTVAPQWRSQDIGAVGVAGGSTATGDSFTVRGSGADVWGSADAFHFAWRPMTGDGDIVARVTSAEYVHDWVKAGVMIRDQLTANSAHAFMVVTPGIKGHAFQRRTASGGVSVSTSGGAGTPPSWVKLERRGNVVSAYRSNDGVTWTLVGSDSFTMGETVYVGLAVSSHDNTRLAAATFEGVAVR